MKKEVAITYNSIQPVQNYSRQRNLKYKKGNYYIEKQIEKKKADVYFLTKKTKIMNLQQI